MAGICDLWCEGCDYLSLHAAVYCDYLTQMGRRRPCPAGMGCTERMLRQDPPRPDRRLREQDRARRAAEEREAERKRRELANDESVASRRATIWAAEQKRQELRERRDANLRRWLATMPEDMKAQRETILAWRMSRDLTQMAAARMIGVSDKTMHDWEMGRYRAKWDKLEKAGCKRP